MSDTIETTATVLRFPPRRPPEPVIQFAYALMAARNAQRAGYDMHFMRRRDDSATIEAAEPFLKDSFRAVRSAMSQDLDCLDVLVILSSAGFAPPVQPWLGGPAA